MTKPQLMTAVMDIITSEHSSAWKRFQIKALLEKEDVYELVEAMTDLLILLNIKVELLQKRSEGGNHV